MSKKKPLTPDEVQTAADQFFPLFKIVAEQMPDGSTSEDCLKVMEAVSKLAHFNRSQEPKPAPFGFNKQSESATKDD